MRRNPNDFLTHFANRLAQITSDAREAERIEHIGRHAEVEQYFLDVATQLEALEKSLSTEMDVRCLSPVFQDIKRRK